MTSQSHPKEPREAAFGAPLSRRQAVARLGIATAALAAGCTPLRILLRDYPAEFDAGEPADGVLRAFAATVVPGMPEADPHLIRPFHDRGLSPLPRYRGFLAADLCARAERRAGAPFDRLEPADRTAVIQDGLRADRTTRRLYRGAILLVQIACYAGIYDDEAGCPLIGFEGRYRPRPWSEITYADPHAYLARPRTTDGNHA